MKWAILLNWNVTGSKSELFLIVHNTSACSPTGTSPKSNFVAGAIVSRTGRAVPVKASSTNVSSVKK